MQRIQASSTALLQQPISDLKLLTFGIEELHRLFRELRGGKLVFFHGSRIVHVLSESLCVLSMIRDINEGLDSSVVFVDGGNIFDPYLISETARLLNLNPEEALKNIWVSRAFTSYQLTALITEKLPEILDQEGSRLVVISDIAALYCDPDVGVSEAKRTFNQITLFLWDLARKRSLLLVTTSISSMGKRKRRLEQYLSGRADIAARVEAGTPHLKITFEKHPSRPTASANFFWEPSIQSRLEAFREV